MIVLIALLAIAASSLIALVAIHMARFISSLREPVGDDGLDDLTPEELQAYMDRLELSDAVGTSPTKWEGFPPIRRVGEGRSLPTVSLPDPFVSEYAAVHGIHAVGSASLTELVLKDIAAEEGYRSLRWQHESMWIDCLDERLQDMVREDMSAPLPLTNSKRLVESGELGSLYESPKWEDGGKRSHLAKPRKDRQGKSWTSFDGRHMNCRKRLADLINDDLR